MRFRIQCNKKNGFTVIKIIGSLTDNSVSEIMKLVNKHMSETLAIDLSETTEINSSGLGVLIYCLKLVRDNDKELIFIKPKDYVLEILESTNLTKVFKIVDELPADNG